MYFPENLLLRWKRWGTLAFCRWLCCQFILKILRWETILFYCRNLRFETSNTALPIPVVFRKINQGELEKRIQQEKTLWPAIGSDFALGCDCVVGEYNKKIIFYAWINYRRIYDRNLMNFGLPPKAAYIYRVFTVPAFRNNGIAQAGYQFVFSELQKKDFQYCLVAVSFVNSSSIRAIKNAGFQKQAKLACLKFPVARILLFENISAMLRKIRGEESIRELAKVSREGVG